MRGGKGGEVEGKVERHGHTGTSFSPLRALLNIPMMNNLMN